MSDSTNKDPLEEFFQKKSGDYEISYREEDWQSLEGRLDALNVQYAARRRRRWAAAAVFLIISLLSYFIYQNYQEINSLNEQLSRQDQQQPVTNPAPDSITGEATPENETSIPDIADLENTRDDNSAGNNDHNRLFDAGTQPDEEIAADAQPEQNQTDYGNATAPIAISELTCKECELSESTITGSQELETNRVSGTYAANVPAITYMNAKDESQNRSGLALSGNGLSRVTFGLVLGPDMSTAGDLTNFYNPGSKIGITIDYSITDRWAVSLGAIRSKVNYKAGSSEYSPPAGYWYDGIEADLTRAACVLIDVPVNVSYRFLLRDQYRLYASAGLSSYIMLNEDYRFSYNNEQPEYPQRWNEDTGTKHFLSTANISVGYEYDLSKSISLRAEPFFRIPINEIGWGDVNLYSVGSLFSINYNLRGL